LPEDRKSTQRERLLRGMSEIAAHEGYAAATIAKVINHAGVSRPTFYEYFADKDDCFIAAHRDVAERLVGAIKAAVARAKPQRALHTAVRALTEFASTDREQAQLLVCEALAGGPRAQDERDRVIGEIVEIVERRHRETPPGTKAPDAPTWAILGGIHWLLVPRLRGRERDLADLQGELMSWMDSYRQTAREHRWRTLTPARTLPPSPYVSQHPLQPPAQLPRGTAGVSREELAANRRERILHATAEVSAREGYNAATIAEIAAVAGVDPRAFNAEFPDKQQAFLAAHELGFRHHIAVAAGAFYSAGSWPERAWRGILAGAQFEATHPTLTHMLFVQSYAIGAPAVQRIDETHAAFTVFLQEGNQPGARKQSRTALEAMVAAGFEIAYHVSRQGDGDQMTRYAGHAAYVCLAPFLGAADASKFIDQKLAQSPDLVRPS